MDARVGHAVRNQTVPRHEIRFDEGRHPRAKVGYVLLASEQTIQDDVFQLRPPGVGIHLARVPMPNSVTCSTLDQIKHHLAEAAALLLTADELDVACYACTSGSLVIGEENVFAELRKGAPSAKPTSLITGVIRALRQLGARRISMCTPYLEEINIREADYLYDQGIEVLNMAGLDLEYDSDMVRVTPEFIVEYAKKTARPDSDALFISCGALRSLDVVGRIEQELGKPVVVSNQAMIWDTLRLANVNDRFEDYGRLLRDH